MATPPPLKKQQQKKEEYISMKKKILQEIKHTWRNRDTCRNMVLAIPEKNIRSAFNFHIVAMGS